MKRKEKKEKEKEKEKKKKKKKNEPMNNIFFVIYFLSLVICILLRSRRRKG